MNRRKLVKLFTLASATFSLPLTAMGGEDYIQVSKKGGKIDPPVPTSKIPPGAWMCAMGKVHFAALEQGNGSCPLCGMKLTQKKSEQ
jgi:hypothetical protein